MWVLSFICLQYTIFRFFCLICFRRKLQMLEIYDLQTEYRTDPIGLDESNPAVSALDRRPDLLAG